MAGRKRKRRVNSADSPGFPIGQMIPVEAIRFNADKTISVVVNDSELPASLTRDIDAVPNRKRKNSGKARTAKKKRRKSKAIVRRVMRNAKKRRNYASGSDIDQKQLRDLNKKVSRLRKTMSPAAKKAAVERVEAAIRKMRTGKR